MNEKNLQAIKLMLIMILACMANACVTDGSIECLQFMGSTL